MRLLTRTLLVLLIVAATLVGYSFYVSRPAVDIAWNTGRPYIIADPEAALTFARTSSQLIRVTRHTGDAVEGIDISAGLGAEGDLIEAYARLGYEGLATVSGAEVTVPVTSLTMPTVESV